MCCKQCREPWPAEPCIVKWFLAETLQKGRVLTPKPSLAQTQFCPKPIETQLSTSDKPRPAEPCSVKGFLAKTHKKGTILSPKPSLAPTQFLSSTNWNPAFNTWRSPTGGTLQHERICWRNLYKERIPTPKQAWLRPSLCLEPIEFQLSTSVEPWPATPFSTWEEFLAETYNSYPQTQPSSDPFLRPAVQCSARGFLTETIQTHWFSPQHPAYIRPSFCLKHIETQLSIRAEPRRRNLAAWGSSCRHL